MMRGGGLFCMLDPQNQQRRSYLSRILGETILFPKSSSKVASSIYFFFVVVVAASIVQKPKGAPQVLLARSSRHCKDAAGLFTP